MAWRGAWRLSAIMRRSRARHRPARMLASHCSPRRCSLARMQARLPMDAARRGRFCDGCTPGVASSSCRRQSMPHRRAVLAKRDPRRRARRMQDAARGQRRRGERPLEEGPRDGAGTARVREIALHRQPLPRVTSSSVAAAADRARARRLAARRHQTVPLTPRVGAPSGDGVTSLELAPLRAPPFGAVAASATRAAAPAKTTTANPTCCHA